MHLQVVNHEKAAHSTIIAHANFNLADKEQRKKMDQHAIEV